MDRQAELTVKIPKFIHEIVEQVAFLARVDQRIDKRSGVSQRMPISCMENAISNAERRALLNGENLAVPRLADIYAALPAITGKLELEYEGELRGADALARELIRESVLRLFPHYFSGVNTRQIVDFFELGGTLKLDSLLAQGAALKELKKVQGLIEKASEIHLESDDPSFRVAAAEFMLEGLHAQKKISRSEDRGFFRNEEKKQERFQGEFERVKKPFN
jgi:magnesium chelatase subunit I